MKLYEECVHLVLKLQQYASVAYLSTVAMEELRQLEEAQWMLTLMQSHGFISSSCQPSNRFLANFFLLLIKPCGDLDLNHKRTLISRHLPKISTSFLEDASVLLSRRTSLQEEKVSGSQTNSVGNTTSSCNDRKDNALGLKGFDDTPLICMDAMQRANSTLEDFCRSYFMFHGMDANSPQSIFKYLPVLSFTESYIYQMDSLNEKIASLPANNVAFLEKEDEMLKCNESIFKSNPFGPLVAQLECHGVITERILEELVRGEEYWALERKLCPALVNQKEISVEDVMKAVHLKSFDYRVLNLLLYQLRGEKVNDLHMEFLSTSEFLVEVSDDLFDYEDDVVENNFNILRMFVKIYGPSMAPIMLAKQIAVAEEKYENLLKDLDPQLSAAYQRRCVEATGEGGNTSGHPLGTWSIPHVIVDEESYRRNCLSSQ